MKQRRFTYPPLILSLILAACGTLSPRPDPSKFFTLSASYRVEDMATKDPSNAEPVSLGIGPIKFPGYLDRQEIVLRTAPNRFEVSENDRWAEPLDENFARVLAQNLSGLLRTDRVISFPWPRDRTPDFQVEIEVLRFEANAAREAHLSARWIVRAGGTKKPLYIKISNIAREPNEKSVDGSVAALSAAVGDLSREIAETIWSEEAKKR
jgi:uncharacterized protein